MHTCAGCIVHFRYALCQLSTYELLSGTTLFSDTLVFQNGVTPLMAASFSGHADVVSTLIEANVDINQRDKVMSSSNFYICTHSISSIVHVLPAPSFRDP